MRRCLWLVCAALCLALLCACGQKQPEIEPPKQEPEPEPEPIRITALLCSDGELTLRFHRDENDNWVWTDNPAFPLDGACVDALADDAAALDELTPLPDAEGPEAYGLYDASKYVTVDRSDGSSVTWHFGVQNEDGVYYASPEADPTRICLAPGTLLEQVHGGVFPMAVLPELPALSMEQIRSVTLTLDGEEHVFTAYGGQWQRDGKAVTDESTVSALDGLLASPTVDRCADYTSSAGALEYCGLRPALMQLQVAYTDESGDGEYTLAVGRPMEAGAFRFVTVNDDSMTVYLMDAALLDALLAGAE